VIRGLPTVFPIIDRFYLLLQLILSIVDGYRVIMPVEAMDQGLDAWLVKMAEVRCCLSRFLSQYHCVGVNQAECIDHHLREDNTLYFLPR